MKKILLAVLLSAFILQGYAQADMWMWIKGKYVKAEKVDSLTFTNLNADMVPDTLLVDGHEYVDLGLSSGTKWATCNVGARFPTDFGYYFAWGETTQKDDYYWIGYKWCKESYDKLTKYCSSSEFGKYDGLDVLLTEDDAATANWGNNWVTPTYTQLSELKNGCDWEWIENYRNSGVSGRVGTSKTNGNTIFLPACGDRYGTGFWNNDGYYWSTLDFWDFPSKAYHLHFNADEIELIVTDRKEGMSVRAVVKK